MSETAVKPNKVKAPTPDPIAAAEAASEAQAGPSSSFGEAGAPTAAADDTIAQAVTRSTRKPFGTTESKLGWPAIPGFFLYWFNDTPGRIERAKEAGYEHVKDRAGQPVSMVVDPGTDGKGLRGYLMKIPEQWREDDAKRLEAEDNRSIENAILRGRRSGAHGDGKVSAAASDGEAAADHTYIPKSGIELRQSRKPF